MAVVIINLYKSIQEAIDAYQESPQVEESGLGRYDGIQLLPNHEYPYTQITDHPTGIELEDATVKVMRGCEELGDITAYFTIDDVFTDDSGMPQIQWSLRGVPTDFGERLVHLKITQTAGEIFYTNLFRITAYREKFVKRFDYWDSSYSHKQSISVITWRRQFRNADTQNNYVEKSTNNTRSNTVIRQTPEVMFTDMWYNLLWLQMVRVLQSNWVYRDLQRVTLFETPEIPDVEGDTNSKDGEYLLTVIAGDTYDPNYIAPVPPIVEDTITFKAIAYIKPNDVGNEQYRIYFSFPIMADLDVIVFGFSDVGLNNETVTLNSALSNTNGGNVNVMTNYAGNGDVVGQAHLQSFTIRVTDGTDSVDYSYTTPTVVFTFTDIQNGIEKEIEATITDV